MSGWNPVSYVQYAMSAEQQWQQEGATALPVRLERTSEPVWQEDEEAELAQPGATPVPLMASDEADAALRSISVALPDRLVPVRPQSSPSALAEFGYDFAVPGCDHVAFNIPPSYSAPESLILRRLQLGLVLSSEGRITPVAVFMQPGSDVDVNVHKIGEVGLDLGQILSTVLPQLPAVFTARVGTEMDVTSVHPKIQASGLLKHECSWRVADSQIAYGFNPALMAQFSAYSPLTVSATLHVEVRKRVLGIFHKTYAKSASPMTYVYRHGQPLMTAYDYVEQLKDLGGDQDLYRDRIAGSQAIYRVGRQFEETDQARAEVWYQRAADAGSIEAMLRLGQLTGKRDRDEADRWYQRAADTGGSEVMYRLGNQLQDQDQARAGVWYQRAADAGSIEAMLRLGRLAEKRDRDEAGAWYRRAADAGSAEAKKDLKRIYPWKHFIMRYRH